MLLFSSSIVLSLLSASESGFGLIISIFTCTVFVSKEIVFPLEGHDDPTGAPNSIFAKGLVCFRLDAPKKYVYLGEVSYTPQNPFQLSSMFTKSAASGGVIEL